MKYYCAERKEGFMGTASAVQLHDMPGARADGLAPYGGTVEVNPPIPNELTRQAMYEAENGIGLRRFGNADDMFTEPGIG
jgi:hypothetical protein